MKTTKLFFILILLMGFVFGNVYRGLPASFCFGETKHHEPRYWKKLAKYAPYQLKFTPRLEDTAEYNKKTDFKKLFDSITTKTLVLELKPLAQALEKSGLAEPILLELAADKEDFILGQIGKVTPTQKDGKPIIRLPQVAPVKILKKYLEEVLQKRLEKDLPLNTPEGCLIVFKDIRGNIKLKAPAQCYFPFQYKDPAYEQLARFIAKEEFKEAEIFCNRLEKQIEVQKQCFRTLGDAFFEKGDNVNAASCYTRCNYRGGFNKIGMSLYDKGELLKSIDYFEKGKYSINRAYAYSEAADFFLTQDNQEKAKEYYIKAVADFENMLKNYDYTWNSKDSNERRRCIEARDSFPQSQQEITQQKRLEHLLESGRDYCDRLYNNFFHFFCEEVITETTDLSWEMVGTFATGSIPITKKKYIYEYQLIKEEDGKVYEQRTLIKQDGVSKNIPNAPLMTKNQYRKLIFGPIAFLGKSWQDSFDYKILCEDTYKKDKVIIIEAIPKKFRKHNALIGNIWIKENKGGDIDILKLEWNPKTILNNFSQLLELKERFRAKLVVDFFAEFDIKRKGFRLPSRYYIEEAYIKDKKDKFVRLKTEVIFREHRYFSVSSEVISTDRDK